MFSGWMIFHQLLGLFLLTFILFLLFLAIINITSELGTSDNAIEINTCNWNCQFKENGALKFICVEWDRVYLLNFYG